MFWRKESCDKGKLDILESKFESLQAQINSLFMHKENINKELVSIVAALDYLEGKSGKKVESVPLKKRGRPAKRKR